MTTETLGNATEPMWCRATRRDGERCHAWPDASGFCPFHRPGQREAAALGGKNSSKAARLEKKLPTRLRPILELLEKALQQCHRGEISPSVATAMASVAGAIIKTLEHGDYELRISRLEGLFKHEERSWS